MTARSGLLAAGNWIVDKIKFIDVYPGEEALANIGEQATGNGGSPFNLLVDLARMGVDFPLGAVGLVGDDADGRWILAECQRHGIDTGQLRTHATAPTSFTDVMTVRSTGRRTFFHQRGANAHLEPEHFDFSRSRAKIFHLGYLLLLDALDGPDPEFGTAAARVLHAARASGFLTSVDVVSEDSERFAQVVLPALRQVDFCILNEFELARTTGLPTRTEGRIDLSGIERAAGRLLGAGVRRWVVVHFPEGAAALGRSGGLEVCPSLAVPANRIVNTVGAGDAFAAGVLRAFHDDRPIADALRWGMVAAAACLLGAGCSDGLRPLDDCLALETEFGSRPALR
jgi:sugar/nucleoside kinase (ribokinase family)